MQAFKRVIVVSALTITANSWGYPIYPYAEFFNRINTHRSLNVKSDISALVQSYIEQSSTEAIAKTADEKSSAVNNAASTSSSINTFNNEAFNFDQHSNISWGSAASWAFANQNHSFLIASPRFWYDEQQDKKASDQAVKEIGSLKGDELLVRGNENPLLWVGLNVKDILPGETGKDTAKNKTDALKKDDLNAVDGKIGRVSVSEPDSIALVIAGVFGLLLARRSGSRSEKNLQSS